MESTWKMTWKLGYVGIQESRVMAIGVRKRKWELLGFVGVGLPMANNQLENQ